MYTECQHSVRGVEPSHTQENVWRTLSVFQLSGGIVSELEYVSTGILGV